MHSTAMASAFAWYSGPLLSAVPSEIPATSASKSPWSPAISSQFRDSGGRAGLGHGAPPSMARGRAGQPGHDQPVSVRSEAITSHAASVEHTCGKKQASRKVYAARACRAWLAGHATAAASRAGLPISAWWWMLAAAAAVVIVAFVVTTWLLTIASGAKPGTDRANSRLDAVRTGGGESAEPAPPADQASLAAPRPSHQLAPGVRSQP
jgi:hypothetical protein